MGCRAAEGKREREKGWAGVAHAGVRRGKGKGKARPGWVGLPSSFLPFSSFLFLFYTQTIQTKPFEFKQIRIQNL
jgi:hypothetical protein